MKNKKYSEEAIAKLKLEAEQAKAVIRKYKEASLKKKLIEEEKIV